jgi:hypothetical protein
VSGSTSTARDVPFTRNVTMVALPFLVVVRIVIRRRPVARAPQCVALVGPTSVNGTRRCSA